MTRLAMVLAVGAGVTSFAVLVGYGLHRRALITLWPGLQGMSPATAAGLLALTAAILLEGLRSQGQARAACVVAIVAGLAVTGTHVLAGRDAVSPLVSTLVFGFDQGASEQTSPATALCLLALGAAGLMRDRARRADLAAGVALVTSGMGLLGYAYGVVDLYAVPAFRSMAVHTAAALFALAMASLLIRPGSGWAAVLGADTVGGASTRRQLAFTLFPPLAGFVLLQATRADHVGPAAAMACLVILTVTPLALLILRDGAVLDRLEAERRAKAEILAATARTLQTRLAEQAVQLQRDAALEREREAALRDSQDFTRLALSAVGGVGVWTYDAASDRFFCDASIAALYGLDPPQAMAGLSREGFLANVHPADRAALATTMAAALARSGDVELEYRIAHPDGSTRWVLSRGHTYHDEAGRPVRRTGVGIDMTKQRLLEEQLRQSQKMEAVGQLTGGVAHDFNNLLTVIRSSIDLLKRPNLTDERRNRYIEAISDTATRAAKLTGQLLAFARRQALKPEVFDVVDSVQAIGDMVVTLTGPRVGIETRVPEQPCRVNADPSQFDTAIINLAVNARDAMNGEGTLTIAVGTATAIPALRAHPALAGDYITVSIIDTGSGIAPEHRERIFEPFFTTKGVGQGTGLGLSQVFGFVKQSGGEVAVSSDLGRGTTLTLYLPRAVGETTASVRAALDRQPVDGHGTCVLVVEDNAEVGSFAIETLEELGYRSVLACDAAAALAALAAEAGRFDVVFSDVVMPGMTGIELGRQIRVDYPDIPVVLTSGYSHVLAQHGTDGFELLHKPYSLDQLSLALTKAAQWRRRSRALEGASSRRRAEARTTPDRP